MSEVVEITKLFTLAVLVPLAVFTTNWLWRYDKGYSQTAAADFILGMLIFDTSAVIAGKEFSPFMRSTELIPLITYWHFGAAFVSALVWWAIATWGEPVIEAHYRAHRGRRFPFAAFAVCWMSVLALIAIHIGFFVVKVGSGHA